MITVCFIVFVAIMVVIVVAVYVLSIGCFDSFSIACFSTVCTIIGMVFISGFNDGNEDVSLEPTWFFVEPSSEVVEFVGPFSLTVLRDMISSRVVSPNALVCDASLVESVSAQSLPFLSFDDVVSFGGVRVCEHGLFALFLPFDLDLVYGVLRVDQNVSVDVVNDGLDSVADVGSHTVFNMRTESAGFSKVSYKPVLLLPARIFASVIVVSFFVLLFLLSVLLVVDFVSM